MKVLIDGKLMEAPDPVHMDKEDYDRFESYLPKGEEDG